MKWIPIEHIDQLATIRNASFDSAQIIFKHSTRCNISADALAEMDRSELEAWYLDLLAYRDISDKIAEEYGVIHKSPQVIVIRNGEAVYNESHWHIRPEDIAASL